MPETIIDLRNKGNLSYLIRANRSWNDKLRITQADKVTPVSLVGAVIVMNIRSDATVLETLSVGNGITIGGAGNNELTFVPEFLPPGKYNYLIEITLAAGERYEIEGYVTAYE